MSPRNPRSGARRLAIAATLGAAGAAGLVALSPTSASAQQAAPDGCVTRHEFRQVEKGDTKREVRRTFGTPGELGNGGAGGFDQLYPQCSNTFTGTTSCQVKVEFVVRASGKPRVFDKKFNGVCPD